MRSWLAGKPERLGLAIAFVVIVMGAGGYAAPRLAHWFGRPKTHSARLDLLQAALAEFNAKRYAQATALLDQKAALIEPTALDWMLRAHIAQALGRVEDALEHLKQVADHDPLGSQARLEAGQIELARGHARAAEAAFLKVVELNSANIQAHRELAYIYGLQRRKRDCDEQFGALARLMAFDYVLAFGWGQNNCGIWDPQEAISLLKKFVTSDPDDRWSRLALAGNYRLAGQFDQVAQVLEPLGEDDADARAIRVQAAIDRVDLDAAARLARNGPADHVRLNALRGSLALQAGAAAQAVEHFRAGLRSDPNDRDSLFGLGTALSRLKDPAAAEYLRVASLHDRMKRIIVECGNSRRIDLKVFPRLGELCESLGRPDQARVWYQVAIGWDPLDSESQARLRRLERTGTIDSVPGSPRS
jgi:tetratricopeptide (TPR) repeat protein